MQELFNKAQVTFNDLTTRRIDMLQELIMLLLDTVEDHEKDMKKMAEEINRLKSLSEKD